MSTTSSNRFPARRITQADEAFLRRFRADMKFVAAGPFARLLDPIRLPKPVRDKAGNVVDPQPRYAATSPESWALGRRLPAISAVLERLYGREHNSVLDEPEPAPKPKRRRRGGRGRKPAAS